MDLLVVIFWWLAMRVWDLLVGMWFFFWHVVIIGCFEALLKIWEADIPVFSKIIAGLLAIGSAAGVFVVTTSN